MEKNRILLGSPVHQKPEILKEFLECLICLKQENVSIDYYFLDDNDDPLSRELLKSFSEVMYNTTIIESDKSGSYACDENTHYWNDGLVWKVAAFKDEIISMACEKSYDFLFLVDSDILVHPDTLQQLVSLNKDIVSEIFWTQWYPNSCELPNVWLFDHYDLVPKQRGESLTADEAASRQTAFLEQLKNPGVYEVGMLGACSLLSRNALIDKISFKPVHNLTLWGEDRHFCIRAASLGFRMYVDTHDPALHIYRESKLSEVPDFKAQAGIVNTVINLNPYKGKSCPICGSGDLASFHDYGTFKLFCCKSCELLFQIVSEKADAERLVSEVYGESWIEMRDRYSKDTFLGHAKFNNILLEAFCPAKGRLLEIGSGTGEFLFMAREAGWDVTGVEPSECACRYARQKFGLELVNKLWSPDIFREAESFNAIVFWHVLEHIFCPVEFLEEMASLLKPDGSFCFSLPNRNSITNEVSGFSSPLFTEADHIMHYNRDNLLLLLDKAELESIALFSRQEPQGLESIAVRMPDAVPQDFEKIMALSAQLQSAYKGHELICIAKRKRAEAPESAG